jgi:hypothetical protein
MLTKPIRLDACHCPLPQLSGDKLRRAHCSLLVSLSKYITIPRHDCVFLNYSRNAVCADRKPIITINVELVTPICAATNSRLHFRVSAAVLLNLA